MRLKIFGVALVSFMVCFVATAFAAGAVNPADESIGELARQMIEAIKDGKGWLAASLGVILLLGLAKKYVPASWKLGAFMKSDAGGMISAFVLAFAGAIATAAVSFTDGSGMTYAIAAAAAKVGLGAIGGFVVVTKLAAWFVGTAWFQSKAPAWLKAGLAFVLGIIGSSAAEKAKKAGDAAVAANPPQGHGTFTDV